MQNPLKLKKINHISVLFFLSFLVWITCFRGFLFGNLALDSDALAYYDHFKYYFDNITRGQYPLWEPTRISGVPIEFFLRRIGSFNPLIFITVILHFLGLSYIKAYLLFLAVYFFLGMIGFYLLAERIFNDKHCAFVACLLLMFSSLATRQFDSYFNLTLIPMIWFFTFLVAFSQDQKRHYFLGLTLCSMILVTTYIPFYFFNIFATFIIFYLLFYYKDFLAILKKTNQFFQSNKIIVILCLLVFLLSLIPGISFFLSADDGEMVLPGRHSGAETANIMGVSMWSIVNWGIEEDILYSLSFPDARNFKFAILYIPTFAFLILLCSLFMKASKRLVFFFVWLLSILFMFAHHAPFYEFIHEKIFYFKYFRNLHFFLWMIILPVFILFVVEQFRILITAIGKPSSSKPLLFIYIFSVHVLAAWFTYQKGNAIYSTYIVLLLSFSFFTLHLFYRLKQKSALYSIALFVVIICQPVEMYHYLRLNSPELVGKYLYGDKKPYLEFSLPNRELFEDQRRGIKKFGNAYSRETPFDVYMGMKWYNLLRKSIPLDTLAPYLYSKFVVYDRVEWMPDERLNLERVAQSLAEFRNLAFIHTDKERKKEPFDRENYTAEAEVILEGSKKLEILDYNVNSIKLKTRFDTPKFLVYNDNYHSAWQAFINGEKAEIFRSNVTFKGIWLPKGENILYLRFGEKWHYALNISLLLIFFGMFLSMMYLWITKDNQKPIGRV